MLPGPDSVIACPYCGSLARRHTLLSGNTLGAILWSDGKLEAPMLPQFPAVTKCHGCQHFYWVDEAEVKGTTFPLYGYEADDVPKEWKHAAPVDHLTIDECEDATMPDHLPI